MIYKFTQTQHQGTRHSSPRVLFYTGEGMQVRRYFSWVLPATALLLCASAGVRPAMAQGQKATISGTVTDASGAAVAGAKIEVKDLDTGVTNTVIGDAQGRYTAPTLPYTPLTLVFE
jgi:hypothetical protein